MPWGGVSYGEMQFHLFQATHVYGEVYSIFAARGLQPYRIDSSGSRVQFGVSHSQTHVHVGAHKTIPLYRYTVRLNPYSSFTVKPCRSY